MIITPFRNCNRKPTAEPPLWGPLKNAEASTSWAFAEKSEGTPREVTPPPLLRSFRSPTRTRAAWTSRSLRSSARSTRSCPACAGCMWLGFQNDGPLKFDTHTHTFLPLVVGGVQNDGPLRYVFDTPIFSSGFNIQLVSCWGGWEAFACASQDRLSCLMVTYPSTRAFFEDNIQESLGIGEWALAGPGKERQLPSLIL